WVLDHEDAPPIFWGGNPDPDVDVPDAFRQHGTAVIGVLASPNNGYGTTGIASDASIGVCTVERDSYHPFAPAISDATGQLRAGDILLIEQQGKGPSSGLECTNNNPEQWEYIAIEYWQAEYDAILTATARGIIVVEAAGNGGMHLDSDIYGRRFD